MNENEKSIQELEQELETLDQKRIEMASNIFSLKLNETVAAKIKEYEQEDDDFELRLVLKE